MEWREIEVNGGRSLRLPDKVVLPAQSTETNAGKAHKIGGIIKNGEWAWLASNCTLEIFAIRSGHSVASYGYHESNGFNNCIIKDVVEVFPGNTECLLLAVFLENLRASGGSTYITIFSLEHSNILSYIELKMHIECATFMDSSACRRTLLQNFNGCLAVGCADGAIILLDLNIQQLFSNYHNCIKSDDVNDMKVSCQIFDYNLPLIEIHKQFKKCQKDGLQFGLKMEVIENPTSVTCIQPIDVILGIAVGYDDGRLALYDLPELQIFYISQLDKIEGNVGGIRKISYLEPADDPRPCLYIWTMHESVKSLTAVLYGFMYEKRMLYESENSYILETYLTGSKRLKIPLEVDTQCKAIASQSIIKFSNQHEQDDSHSLCIFNWYSGQEDKNKLLIFDLNQWYKEQMPCVINWSTCSTFLAGYKLSGQKCALNGHVNPLTIAHFNSIQRYEEHFYPNSLSFDYSLLLCDGFRYYNWEGLQNRVINCLKAKNATIFLELDTYFDQIIQAHLLPQFSELNANAVFSNTAKCETLLSVALENNCYNLLRDCGNSWADGSYMGNSDSSTGLCLSTLTIWLWKRATDIKTRCNDLCKGLFEAISFPLDQREQKEMGFLTRQLKLLADLLSTILTVSKKNIPVKVFTNLQTKYKSVRMAAEYQEVLLWLLNINLLPESTSTNLISAICSQLKEEYANKRKLLAKIDEEYISPKTGSCRLLYIDRFIQEECQGETLRDFWREGNGDGLYPPTSIESMLRVMLVPDVRFETKCAVLLYFFLDLHLVIDEETYKSLVANLIKFPSVFKLSASLIKTVQSFWNLDHGHYLPAVDEFISPFNNNKSYPEWMLGMLIETLLAQNVSNIALRILEARSTLISPILRLKTLLANGLITEAFHFVRSTHDDSLLELFFKCCLSTGQFGVIRDLALSRKEGQLVEEILQKSKTHSSESLHLVYLLQKSKYLEAVSYMDKVSRAKPIPSNFTNSSSVDASKLVLSAFSTTMAPVTQGLTDVYFRIKNKIKKKEVVNDSPEPLSCQLIKQNANDLLGGIYHSSALSAHFATYYWNEAQQNGNEYTTNNNLLHSTNAPFLRKPQAESHYLDFYENNKISYPQVYKAPEKRTLAEAGDDETEKPTTEQNNPKKRRRLVGPEILNELNYFSKLNTSSRLNISEFTFSNIALNATESATSNTIDDSILTRPLITKCEQVMSTPKLIGKPSKPGILKMSTPEVRERQYDRHEMHAEDERNIRFQLPTTGQISLDENIKTGIGITVEMDEIVDDEMNNVKLSANFIESKSNDDHCVPLKMITRSISVDSNETGDKSESEENFYSPISMKNVSITGDSVMNNSANNTDNKISFLSGPQPRRALARFSVERTEKSLTPEPSLPVCSSLSSKLYKNTGITLPETENIVVATPGGATVTPIMSVNVEKQERISSGFRSDDFTTTKSRGDATQPISSKFDFALNSAVMNSANDENEFVPKIYSSRVCETQSKFELHKLVNNEGKISEHSTVVGGLTYVESSIDVNRESEKVEDENIKMNVDGGQQMFDTTLGMSSYDLTILDGTSNMANSCKPIFCEEKDVKALRSIEDIEIDVTEVVEEAEEVQIDTSHDSNLYDAAIGIYDVNNDNDNSDVEMYPMESENVDEDDDDATAANINIVESSRQSYGSVICLSSELSSLGNTNDNCAVIENDEIRSIHDSSSDYNAHSYHKRESSSDNDDDNDNESRSSYGNDNYDNNDDDTDDNSKEEDSYCNQQNDTKYEEDEDEYDKDDNDDPTQIHNLTHSIENVSKESHQEEEEERVVNEENNSDYSGSDDNYDREPQVDEQVELESNIVITMFDDDTSKDNKTEHFTATYSNRKVTCYEGDEILIEELQEHHDISQYEDITAEYSITNHFDTNSVENCDFMEYSEAPSTSKNAFRHQSVTIECVDSPQPLDTNSEFEVENPVTTIEEEPCIKLDARDMGLYCGNESELFGNQDVTALDLDSVEIEMAEKRYSPSKTEHDLEKNTPEKDLSNKSAEHSEKCVKFVNTTEDGNITDNKKSKDPEETKLPNAEEQSKIPKMLLTTEDKELDISENENKLEEDQNIAEKDEIEEAVDIVEAEEKTIRIEDVEPQACSDSAEKQHLTEADKEIVEQVAFKINEALDVAPEDNEIKTIIEGNEMKALPPDTPSKNAHRNRKKTLIKAFELETLSSSAKLEDNVVTQLDSLTAATSTATEIVSKIKRGASVPPSSLEEFNDSPRRSTRRKSVPRKFVEEDTTPHPAQNSETNENYQGDITTSQRRNLRGRSVDISGLEAASSPRPLSTMRSTSVPPGEHTSNLKHNVQQLATITEDDLPISSPLTRSRSRLARYSVEHELNSTPKSSSNRMSERERGKRAQSVLSQDSVNSSEDTLKRVTRNTRKRLGSGTDHDKSSNNSPEVRTKLTYSSERRLTRHQLALLERSGTLHIQSINTSTSTTSPSSPPVTRSMSRASKSNAHDSDDAESVATYISSGSQIGTRRRRTRSSNKDIDDDDDEHSFVSSSTRQSKRLMKLSPNAILTARDVIDTHEETSEPKKGGRSRK